MKTSSLAIAAVVGAAAVGGTLFSIKKKPAAPTAKKAAKVEKLNAGQRHCADGVRVWISSPAECDEGK